MKSFKSSLFVLAFALGLAGAFAFKTKPATTNFDWYDLTGKLIVGNEPVSDVCSDDSGPTCAFGFTPVSMPPATHSLSSPNYTAIGTRQ
jgi:hypothetical protein